MTDSVWEYCQVDSDQILASGLSALLASSPVTHNETKSVGAGVYLFSIAGKHYYIGEGIDVYSRLKSQLNPRTSTFYKNYLKTDPDSALSIDAFELRVLPALLARKEMEEFGIVNLPTALNRFHSNKREKSNVENLNRTEWDRVQACSDLILSQGEAFVRSCESITWSLAKPCCDPGLYLVSDSNGDLLYIGESTNLRERHMTHGKRTYFSALRRNVGRSLLGYAYIPGTKKKFEPEHDSSVTDYIQACAYACIGVSFARRELEERLILKLRPPLNRKVL